MKKILASTAIGITLAFSVPAFADDNAACEVSWNKLDTKNEGYVMHSSAQAQMKMMKQANRGTAAQDRMTRKEFKDACAADVFKGIQ